MPLLPAGGAIREPRRDAQERAETDVVGGLLTLAALEHLDDGERRVVQSKAVSDSAGALVGAFDRVEETLLALRRAEVLELLGIETRRSVDTREAVERCVDLMITEAVRSLEDNVVRSPEELDLAMVMGIGFPPFRGGLLRYADSVGLSVLVDRLRAREGSFGSRFQPPNSLVRRAKSGKGFY